LSTLDTRAVVDLVTGIAEAHGVSADSANIAITRYYCI